LNESFSVLARDKRLLVFPLASFLATAGVVFSFAIPLYLSGAINDAALRNTFKSGTSVTYLLLFAFYYANYFVTIFFNSALVGAAGLFLAGGPATVGGGLRLAAKRIGRIASWTLVATTVGVVLRALERRTGRNIVAGIFGIAWSLITYLIVPVLVFEDRPVFESVDRSVALFRKAWGEELTGGLGFGLIGMLAAVPSLLFIAAGYQRHFVLGVSAALVYGLILASAGSAAKGIFTASLYRYAASGDQPAWFSSSLIEGAFAPASGAKGGRTAVGQTSAITATLLSVETIPSDTADTFLIRAQAANTVYHASYTREAVDVNFEPESWLPGTALEISEYGEWLFIKGPGAPRLCCHFFKVAAPAIR
jgi:hypothetical protein